MAKRWFDLRFILFVLALLLAVGTGLWWFQFHHYSVRESIDGAIALLRDAGPWIFFAALAILPAIGFPISVFYLTAGSAFAARMGMGGVLVAAGVALLVNIALTYWLARYGLRPWLEQLISRTKYRIPVVVPAEQVEVTLLLRITPGPPFCIQSYLLGMARIKFSTYMFISWIVAMAYASPFIIFGKAILEGRGQLAFFGLSILVAVVLIVHLLRKHYGKKKAA